MTAIQTMLVLMSATLALGQRSPFAGKRPIGFPELTNITTTTDSLGNRFGEGNGTTERLPVEALGDRDLVERLSKLPVDKQPFWFINWQALEAQRQNPQTYPQKPNTFAVPFPNNNPGGNTPLDSGTSNRNSEIATSNPEVANRNSGNENSNSASSASPGSAIENRNGVSDTTARNNFQNGGNRGGISTSENYRSSSSGVDRY